MPNFSNINIQTQQNNHKMVPLLLKLTQIMSKIMLSTKW